MALLFKNNIQIHILSPKPAIVIWYARISHIIPTLLYKNILLDPRQMRNKIIIKNDFIKPFLNNAEITIVNSFKAMKKQIEWLCGRYLMKLMIQHSFYQDMPLDRINISYMDEGAPFLTNDKNIPISLSHSNNYTATACSNKTNQIIGVDIEKIIKKPDTPFLKTAFTENEILHLQDNAASILKNWTIKEAYLKYIKKGFNESLHNVEVIDDKIWHNKKNKPLSIYSTFLDDNSYVLTLVSN